MITQEHLTDERARHARGAEKPLTTKINVCWLCVHLLSLRVTAMFVLKHSCEACVLVHMCFGECACVCVMTVHRHVGVQLLQ